MRPTPVYIVCSPRPHVGKTLVARLLTEFLLLQHGDASAFDINLNEPSLLDFLPRLTETADISDTFGTMALMDRLIVNDRVAKVIDLGFSAFDNFFQICREIGFTLEARQHNIETVILFLADKDRTSLKAFAMLQENFPDARLITIDNEQVLFGEIPPIYRGGEMMHTKTLPAFIKSIINRTTFSFTDYLRSPNETTELHQWIRANYLNFREMEQTLRATTPRI
jgi:hypothetical protein